MNSLNSMVSVMRTIKAYSLNIGDTVYKELRSYAGALDGISEIVTDAVNEMFLDTAADRGLLIYEKLIGAPRDDLGTEVRSLMMHTLVNITCNDFTPAGMDRFFDTLDLDCDILEEPRLFHILITPRTREYTREEQEYIRSRLEEFLPCHLTFVIEFREAVWDTYDDMDLTFDEWDALDMTWDMLDRYEGE